MKQFNIVAPFYDFYMHTLGLYRDQEILGHLNLQGHERIIDLGGGTGYLANKLLPHCAEVVVLDESPGMLRRAARYGRFQTVCGDMFHTQFDDGSFDVAIVSDILHHIDNRQRLFDEVHRLLTARGVVFVYDFDLTHRTTKLMHAFETLLFQKTYFTDRQAVIEDLEQKNFTKLTIQAESYWFMLRGEKR